MNWVPVSDREEGEAQQNMVEVEVRHSLEDVNPNHVAVLGQPPARRTEKYRS